jgi:curved DNA-binding protein CbpA
MKHRAPHEILGVARDAKRMEIIIAYRKLAMRWHPDRNPNSAAKNKFQEIQQAYDTLRKRGSPASLHELWDEMMRQSNDNYEQTPHSNAFWQNFPTLTAFTATLSIILLKTITWPGNVVAFTLGLLAANVAYKSGQTSLAFRLESAFRLFVRLYFISLLVWGLWVMLKQIII